MICLHTSLGAASVVLEKYQDEFIKVVIASLNLHTLKRMKVISEQVLNAIERAKDSKEAAELLYDHLHRNADMATLRKYCKELVEAKAYPKMQKLGKNMCNDLLSEGVLEKCVVFA